MFKLKSLLAVAVLAATINVVPAFAAAPQLKVVIAGSSAMWTTMALGAYNAGNCITGGTKPCHHYTASGFNLTDSRPTLLGGNAATDSGSLWIVWDSNATTIHVWAYIKVDSVVGQRCYFAQPRCTISLPAFPAPGNLITPNTLWGDNSADTAPPAAVANLFTGAGQAVTVGATDIRPEDGLYATCRANSASGGGPDNLDGLGWNNNNVSGTCPGAGAGLSQLQGGDILSGYPGSVSSAHVIAYNISGTDPFSGTAIPTPTTVSVGASPIVFINSRGGALANLTNATDGQLQTVFSGTNCDAAALGLPAGNIEANLREPLSGTMNTTEYTVFRYPNANGVSQETGVNAVKLSNTPCTAGGGRTRVIGTGEAVKSVKNFAANNGGIDDIAYTFFSYGNVSSIANTPASYGYITLNGVDPIFASYAGGDPAEPGNGTIPGVANLPASCAGAFPCPESSMWTGGKSFPNVRSGVYRSWSVLRLVSNGTPLTNAKTLVTASNKVAVLVTPDYIPFNKVTQVVGGVVQVLDPGFPEQRSHYGPGAHNTGTLEAGRDEGGCIQKKGSAVINLVQTTPGHACITYVAP